MYVAGGDDMLVAILWNFWPRRMTTGVDPSSEDRGIRDEQI